MVLSESREAEWIEGLSLGGKKIDKQLYEKSIRALSLLEALAMTDCPFVFKGGSAVMLHHKGNKRLSFDIDIMCPPETDIDKYIKEIAKKNGFEGYSLDNRETSYDIQKKHAKFHYTLSYQTGDKQKGVVLLDVVFEDIHYKNVVSLPIEASFLKTEGKPVYVKAPSAEDILGDKLTAFAPHTTGIPFRKEKENKENKEKKEKKDKVKLCSTEIIKQMYDIASLLDKIDSFETTSKTFQKFADVEFSYKKNKTGNHFDVLNDCIDTAFCICSQGFYKKKDFENLQEGITSIANFVINNNDKTLTDTPYNLAHAIIDASKVVYIATAVKYGHTEVEKFSIENGNEYIKEYDISNEFNSKIQKLRKSFPEAFYYWCKASEIIRKSVNKEIPLSYAEYTSKKCPKALGDVFVKCIDEALKDEEKRKIVLDALKEFHSVEEYTEEHQKQKIEIVLNATKKLNPKEAVDYRSLPISVRDFQFNADSKSMMNVKDVDLEYSQYKQLVLKCVNRIDALEYSNLLLKNKYNHNDEIVKMIEKAKKTNKADISEILDKIKGNKYFNDVEKFEAEVSKEIEKKLNKGNSKGYKR